MWERIKQKLQSPVVWAAVVAQICGIITLFVPEITETFKIVALSVIELATLFGILNDPNSRGEF